MKWTQTGRSAVSLKSRFQANGSLDPRVGRHDGARPSRMARRRSGPNEPIRCRPAARSDCIGRRSLSRERLAISMAKRAAQDIGTPRRIVAFQHQRRAGVFARRDRLPARCRRYRRHRAVPCSGPARRSAAAHARPRRPARCDVERIAWAARSQAETDGVPARHGDGREWNAIVASAASDSSSSLKRDQPFGFLRGEATHTTLERSPGSGTNTHGPCGV